MVTQTKLFGTDGIRGRVNEFPITAEVALRMGKAVANVLRSAGPRRNRVLIGKDTRISGKDEPCVRGSHPISHVIARISENLRPSGRRRLPSISSRKIFSFNLPKTFPAI